MSLIFFVFASLLVADLLHYSADAVLPFSPSTMKLDDISVLGNTFEAMIERIRQTINRFRCPKGWKRLGGSCYVSPNFTILPSDVNFTCHLLFSEQSNHMQIGNAIEFFYAAHILSRHNLPSLMIEIDPKLAEGRKIVDALMSNPDQWEKMKKLYRQFRAKYRRLKEKVLDRLNGTGLQFLARSKKVKPITTQAPAEFALESDFFDPIITTSTQSNSPFGETNDYDYNYFESADEIDPFEEVDDTRSICHQIDWNVQHNHSNIFLLTTYIVSDKTVCSLSDIEEDQEYHHVCEYVSDFCFANILCGTHGQCENTLTSFKCSCSFLYGGLLCEKISEKGWQILIGIIIIIFVNVIPIERTGKCFIWITRSLIRKLKKCCKTAENPEDSVTEAPELSVPPNQNMINNQTQPPHANNRGARRLTIIQELGQLALTKRVDSSTKSEKRDLCRMSLVGGLTIVILILLLAITTAKHFFSFSYGLENTNDLDGFINDTIKLVQQCEKIADYRMGNAVFFFPALALLFIFSWSVKREKKYLGRCDDRPGLIAPIEPFRIANRFSAATVFGILAFEILKIFEEGLFRTGQPSNHGVIRELIVRIALVMLVGVRYYPVLASLQLRNLPARFFAFLYIAADIAYAIVREGSCMGFVQLSEKYTALEDAKIRLELGTWIIIYGLLKNIPHFFFLSYIGAELFVRFAYDSICLRLKKKESIWSSSVAEGDDANFAKAYVTELFSRSYQSKLVATEQLTQSDGSTANPGEVPTTDQSDQARVQKVLDSIYKSNSNFRFTTMATCTYTVAFVFLYYLTCTFIFLYISRTTGHTSSLKAFIEYTFQIELEGPFSLRSEVIFSALATALLYGFQLFAGIQSYKTHKMQLCRGIYEDIPQPTKKNIRMNNMASSAVHYSGFLVGYMAWGFVICFHLILICCILFRLVFMQIPNIELTLSIVVPIIVIYLLKRLSMTSTGRLLFTRELGTDPLRQDRKVYAIFAYFSFFADCFLGIVSCILRLLLGVLLNLIFIARLDSSFLGRSLEKYDVGFAAYVSFLHIEVANTHPVMLAFCHSVFEDIRQRRSGQADDDECCISSSDSDTSNETLEMRRLQPMNSPPGVTTQDQSGPNGPIESANSNQPGPNMSDGDNESGRSSSLSVQPSQSSAGVERVQHKRRTPLQKKDSVNSNLPPVPRRQDLPSTTDQSENETQNVSTSTSERRKKLKSSTRNSKQEPKDATSMEQRSENRKQFTTVQKKDPPEVEQTDGNDVPRRIPKPNTTDEESTKRESTTRQASKPSKSHSTTTDIVLEISTTKTTIEAKRLSGGDEFGVISVENERSIRQSTTTVSAPWHNMGMRGDDLVYTRGRPSRQAQQTSPPSVVPRTKILSSSTDPAKPNRRSDPITVRDPIGAGVSNRCYSLVEPFQTSPIVEGGQLPPVNPAISELADTEHSANEEDTEDDDEGENERDRLLPNSPSVVEASNPIANPVNDEEEQKKRMLKRKQARFRWHLFYTIINNYQLLDMRKGILNRLALLYFQRNQTILEQQTPVSLICELQGMAETRPQPVAEGRTIFSTPDMAPSPLQLSPPVTGPDGTTAAIPISPAERYVDTRLRMFYDGLPHSPMDQSPVPPSPSLSPLLHPTITSALSGESLGFPVEPQSVVYPPSSSGQGLSQPSASPFFLPVTSSNLSTGGYPLTPNTSIANSTTLRSQMSLDQRMQAWHQQEVENVQRKRRHRYIYDQPRLPATNDKLSAATILIPHMLFLAAAAAAAQPVAPAFSVQPMERRPTPSPFFDTLPRSSAHRPAATRNETTTATTERAPQRSSKDIDTVKQRTRQPPTTEQVLLITTALVHESDSEH